MAILWLVTEGTGVDCDNTGGGRCREVENVNVVENRASAAAAAAAADSDSGEVSASDQVTRETPGWGGDDP